MNEQEQVPRKRGRPKKNKVSPEKTIENEKKPEKRGGKITHFINVKQRRSASSNKSETQQEKEKEKPAVSELDNTNFRFIDGWEILCKRKTLFKYQKDYGYILPTASLLAKKSWKENIHYFKDATVLRKVLCRDGIPIIVKNSEKVSNSDSSRVSKRASRNTPADEQEVLAENVRKYFSDDDLDVLKRWVTLAHIPPEYAKPKFDGVQEMSDKDACSMLKKCGYKYSTIRGYILPKEYVQCNPQTDVTCLTDFNVLRSHVCRHGNVGNRKELDLQDQVRLILWAASEPLSHPIL